MRKHIINVIERIFDTHICQEFTQWEDKEATFESLFSRHENLVAHIHMDKKIYTKRWQERQCTICGKITQRELRY